jgi:hypothetical protein
VGWCVVRSVAQACQPRRAVPGGERPRPRRTDIAFSPHLVLRREALRRETPSFLRLCCEALSEQHAARCIVATGVHLERGLAPRDVESLHPRACMEVPSSCASCKICCQGQITQRRMPDLGQKDSNVIRYEDQEVRRSNTELTDEGPQGDPIH